MKSFQQRSFNSSLFRPKPEILDETQNNALIISTPWGARAGAEKAIQVVQDYYFSARSDMDSTSPFEFLTCLSSAGNDLRVSIMLANDKVFKEENQNEYSSGCELLAIVQSNQELCWVQIGHPAMFLARKGVGIVPLCANLDLALDVSSSEKLLSPLPSTLLGVHETSNFSVHSMAPQEGDKIILISRTFIPASFYALDAESISVEKLVQILAADNPENPFWTGVIDF